MSKEYKITAVSAKPPRPWTFKDKRTGSEVQMESYRVMLEGESEPVEINRKPGNPPKKDELLFGDIKDGEYGKKFTPERKPFGAAPKDTAEIKAEWAIGQAVQLNTDGDLTKIEKVAVELYNMVERVKTGMMAAPRSLADAYRNMKAATADKEDIPVVPDLPQDDFEKEEINLDDIPF